MEPGKKLPTFSKKNEEFHRPTTRLERFRIRLEGLPKVRFYITLLVATWLALTALISIDFNPLVASGLQEDTNRYQVGEVADENVFAARSVSYEDPLATQQIRTEAADQVSEIYRRDQGIAEQVTQDVEEFFASVRDVRSSEGSTEEKTEQIVDAAPFSLPESLAREIVFLDQAEIDLVERYVIEDLRELYDTFTVADNEVTNLPASVINLSEARGRLSDAAGRNASGQARELVDVLSRGFVEPNYVVDRQATRDAREVSANEVEPVMSSVQQGERILSRGEIVDEEDVAQLEALGVIRGTNPWTFFLGVGLVVATEMGMAWYFLERFGHRILRTNALVRVILAASLTILFTALARFFISLDVNPYLTPLAGLSILGTILLGPRLMFLMVVVTSVNVGIIAGNDFYLTAALLLVSGFAIYTVVRVKSRTQLLKAGLIVAVVMALVMFGVSLFGSAELSTALWQGFYGLLNGLLSLMLAMVLLPLLENAFNILTPMKLLELSDPSRPLLQKLLRGAPGTFSHSMQVGVLSENAAERIGANALLARVGAYYHDIGKLEHPAYFIENQMSQVNPHKDLSPALSAKIIKRHVKDGLELGREWNLPQEILEIIAQHHGSTRIEYFYRKALEEALDGETIRESDFRYRCGRPNSKEAGIVMLADSVEATVKSISRPTPKRIEDVVSGTIRHKLEDGQFDECELTMHEIHEIGESLREGLIGFLGPRIEYPSEPASKPEAISKPARSKS